MKPAPAISADQYNGLDASGKALFDAHYDTSKFAALPDMKQDPPAEKPADQKPTAPLSADLAPYERIAPYVDRAALEAAAKMNGHVLPEEILAKTSGKLADNFNFGAHAQDIDASELAEFNRDARAAFGALDVSHTTAQSALTAFLDSAQHWPEDEGTAELRKAEIRGQMARMSDSAELLRLQAVGIEALKAAAPKFAGDLIENGAHLSLEAICAVAAIGREIELAKLRKGGK